MQNSLIFRRILMLTLIIGPLCIIILISVFIIFPAIKDPESKIYHSSIGYPALKRWLKQPIKVETALVQSMTLDKGVAAPGESVALQEVEVRPLVSAIVEKVSVVEGQWVTQGTPLVEIKRDSFEDRVNSVRNDLIIAEIELENLLKTYPSNLIDSQAEVEKNQIQTNLSENDLRILSEIHQERLLELESEVKVAEELLIIAQKKLLDFQSLQEANAISSSQLYDIQEEYKTRQKELIVAQQQLAQAKLDSNLELNETKKEYANNNEALISAQQELIRLNKTNKNDLEIGRRNLENQKIALREAIRDLKNTVIYASINGLVKHVNINSGELAIENSSLITLSKDVVFKAYVDQAQLNAVSIGDSATVRLVTYPGQTFQGSIIRLNPTIETDPDPKGKIGVNRQYTYSIWIKLENLQMPPGLQGYAQINKVETSLVIPESSLIHLSAGEGMIMTINNGQAVVKKVKVGRKFDNQREVLEGLELGEIAILHPRALNPGDNVKPLL